MFSIGTTAFPPPSSKINITAFSAPNSSSLVRRAGETVRIEGNEDPKHRGTLHCFTTGTWQSAGIIASTYAIRYICGYSQADNATAFKYEPFANGSYPHQYTRIGSALGKQYYGYETVTWYDTQLQGPTHANYGECKWAIEKIVLEGGCPWGGNSGKASLGGWFQFEDDGSTYGVDPTFESSSGRSRNEGQ